MLGEWWESYQAECERIIAQEATQEIRVPAAIEMERVR